MTMRPIKLLAAAGLATTSVLAVPYADFDQLNQSATTSQSVSGQFDLTLPAPENDAAYMSGYPGTGNGLFADIAGFQPGMTVTSATISLWLSDPNGGRESWDIDLLVVDPSNNQVTLQQALSSGGSFTKHFQATSISKFAEILVAISETGKLNYEITASEGQFIVDAVMLKVNAEGVGTYSVPDGGYTAAMVGLAFLGMAGASRVGRKQD